MDEKARLDLLVVLMMSEDVVNHGPVIEEKLPAIIRAPNKQFGTRTSHGCLNHADSVRHWIAVFMKLTIKLLDLDCQK